MSKLIDFYRGNGTDHKGRTMLNYTNFTVENLESIHYYIQWAFPSMEPSAYNPDAPLLTHADIEEFKNDEGLQLVVRIMVTNMYKFYMENSLIWLKPNNHNFLRITRIIKFLSIIELAHPMLTISEADYFFRLMVNFYADYPSIIGKETFRFWLDASEYKP